MSKCNRPHQQSLQHHLLEHGAKGWDDGHRGRTGIKGMRAIRFQNSCNSTPSFVKSTGACPNPISVLEGEGKRMTRGVMVDLSSQNLTNPTLAIYRAPSQPTRTRSCFLNLASTTTTKPRCTKRGVWCLER